MEDTAKDLAHRAQAFIDQEKIQGRDVSASEAVAQMVNSNSPGLSLPSHLPGFSAPPAKSHMLPVDAPSGITKDSPIDISRRARDYVAYMKEKGVHVSSTEAVHYVMKTGWKSPASK